MNFGKAGWGIDSTQAWAVLDMACSMGVNVFDTSNFYAGGNSERILGGWVRSRHAEGQVTIMSKAGGADPEEPAIRGLSSASMAKSVRKSLGRLGVESLDVLTLHWPDPSVCVDETLDGIEMLLEQGLILNWSISNYYAGEMVRILERAKARGMRSALFSHVHMNLFEQKALRELVPESRLYGVTTAAWSPLCGGLLSKSTHLDSPKFTDPSSFWHRYTTPAYFRRKAELEALAAEAGLLLHHLALAWLTHWQIRPIFGAHTAEDLKELMDFNLAEVPEQVLCGITETADLCYPHDVLAFSGVTLRRGGVVA